MEGMGEGLGVALGALCDPSFLGAGRKLVKSAPPGGSGGLVSMDSLVIPGVGLRKVRLSEDVVSFFFVENGLGDV